MLELRRAGKPYQLSSSKLSRLLLITAGAMTKRITRLQQAGLVLRVSANDNERSEVVRLTAKGMAIAHRGISEIAQPVQRIMAENKLTEYEIDVMDNALHKLSKAKPIGLEELGGKKRLSKIRARTSKD